MTNTPTNTPTSKCEHPNKNVYDDGYWNCPDCPESGNIDDEIKVDFTPTTDSKNSSEKHEFRTFEGVCHKCHVNRSSAELPCKGDYWAEDTQNTTHNSSENWEEELLNVFYREFQEVGYVAIDSTYESIKSFIRSQIQQAEARGREKALLLIGAAVRKGISEQKP